MEKIKAVIQADEIHNSVEFSAEEVLTRRHGKPWAKPDEADREAELKDYARARTPMGLGLTIQHCWNARPGPVLFHVHAITQLCCSALAIDANLQVARHIATSA